MTACSGNAGRVQHAVRPLGEVWALPVGVSIAGTTVRV